MKTVVITGASRGIGFATATKFLSEGWRVIGTHHHTPTPLTHPHFIEILCDQGDPKSIAHAAAEIKKLAPHIDALINNAGIAIDVRDMEPKMDKIRQTMEVNLFGVIAFTEALLPHLGAGSHIINMDSKYGAFSFPIDDESSEGYRLSKAALNMYTRTLAYRLHARGIIASSVSPGWVITDMGMAGATGEEKPTRQPSEPADELYAHVTTRTLADSGQFWEYGKKREW